MKCVDVVSLTSKYIVVNKPSGIQSNGFNKNCIIPQVTKILKSLEPEKKLDPSRIKLVQRLDKYVTGGLVVPRNEKLAKRINLFLRGDNSSRVSLNRRYVGLIPIKNFEEMISSIPYRIRGSEEEKYKGVIFDNDNFEKGIINFDVKLPVDKKEISYNSLTKFKLLRKLQLTPGRKLRKLYPNLFQHDIVPIILELETGRKNQIRDHILQAFHVPLLNDDNFVKFKNNLPDSNSLYFKSNQIGLHCAYIKLTHNNSEEDVFEVPIHESDDRELWFNFIDSTGKFIPDIRTEFAKW